MCQRNDLISIAVYFYAWWWNYNYMFRGFVNSQMNKNEKKKREKTHHLVDRPINLKLVQSSSDDVYLFFFFFHLATLFTVNAIQNRIIPVDPSKLSTIQFTSIVPLSRDRQICQSVAWFKLSFFSFFFSVGELYWMGIPKYICLCYIFAFSLLRIVHFTFLFGIQVVMSMSIQCDVHLHSTQCVIASHFVFWIIENSVIEIYIHS